MDLFYFFNADTYPGESNYTECELFCSKLSDLGFNAVDISPYVADAFRYYLHHKYLESNGYDPDIDANRELLLIRVLIAESIMLAALNVQVLVTSYVPHVGHKAAVRKLPRVLLRLLHTFLL
jgi:hypothetical protein